MASQHVILVAEDDPGDALLLKRAFGKAGVEGHWFVRDGLEAQDYLAGRPPFHDRSSFPFPRLLILDLKMPRVSGFEVLAWLREQPEFRRLPVVVLSGFEGQHDIDRAYALGANLYVIKPQDPEQLLSVVERLKRKYLLDPAELPVVAADTLNNEPRDDRGSPARVLIRWEALAG
jgi:CheY-like chemotaxis protein